MASVSDRRLPRAHPPQEDRHQERAQLVVGPGAVRGPADERLDLRRGSSSAPSRLRAMTCCGNGRVPMTRLPYVGEGAGGTPNHFFWPKTWRAISNGARVSFGMVDSVCLSSSASSLSRAALSSSCLMRSLAGDHRLAAHLERVELALEGYPVVAQVGLLGLEERAGAVKLVPGRLERRIAVGVRGSPSKGVPLPNGTLLPNRHWRACTRHRRLRRPGSRRLRLSSGRFGAGNGAFVFMATLVFYRCN